MAALHSRLTVLSRLSRQTINIQSATSAKSILRRSTSHNLHSFRNRSTLSTLTRDGLPLNVRTPHLGSVTYTQHRGYAELKASGGKSEADLIVEELQELYENAKDELEIATDSTSGATIYAASDRESARELLDQLTYVYKVYTEMTRAPAAGTPGTTQEETVSPNASQANADRLDAGAAVDAGNPIMQSESLSGDSLVGVTPNYDPEYISVEVKEEVKRRVGQRIRELQSAVERLEQMASHES